MRRSWVAPAVGALFLLAGAGATWQQAGGEQPLRVSAVRFYRPASGTTTIEGVCEVRLSALPAVAGQQVRYRFEVAVFDSAGLELQREGWARAVPPSVASAAGATAMESFEFSAAPGLSRVRLRAVPEGGTAIERDVEVRAFTGRPAMSRISESALVRVVCDSGWFQSSVPLSVRMATSSPEAKEATSVPLETAGLEATSIRAGSVSAW